MTSLPDAASDEGKSPRPSRFALWPLPELEFPPGFETGAGFGAGTGANELQRSYEQGYADGSTAGRETAAGELAPVLEKLHEAVQQVAREKEKIIVSMERNVQVIALAVARQLFQREVEADPTIVGHIVRQALELVPAADKIKVLMNPADLTYVTEHVKPEDRDGSPVRIEWVADSTLERGSCVIDSPERFVDGRIDVLIRDLAQKMDLEDAG